MSSVPLDSPWALLLATVLIGIGVIPLSAALAQRAPAGGPADRPEPGAEATYRWLVGCLEAIEKDIPAITRSAEAAAALYVQDGQEIGAYGDPGLVGEVSGRAGGLMRIARPDAVSKPDWKGIVLLFPRQQALAEDLDAARRLADQGKMVIAFGRRGVLAAAADAGVRLDAAIDSHAAPHGGLFPSPDGSWVVPTDPMAGIAAAWVWTGEFVAALTRQGKMPTMHQSISVPGAMERARKYAGLKFHGEAPARAPAGEFGREFLRQTRQSLAALHEKELAAIVQVAELAVRTRRAGRQTWVFAHGHSITRRLGCPHDPGLFRQVNRGLFELRDDANVQPGDLVFCVGYDRIFQGWFFKDATRRLRAAGAALAWSMTDYNTDADTGPAAIGKGEILVRQHWARGDAVVAVPGYDVKILPSSGVIAEAVLWMAEAEMLRLLSAQPAPVAARGAGGGP